MLKRPPSVRRLLSVIAFAAIAFTAILSIITSISNKTNSAFANDPNNSCPVLSLNGACVDSFDEMLASIKNTTTNNVKLFSDIDDTGSGLYQFKAYTDTTIDLNGHTVSTKRSFLVYGATVTLTGNGKISIDHTFPINFLGSTDPASSNFSVLNVGSGVELESAYNGIWDMMSMSYTASAYLPRKYGITVNFNGKVTQKYPDSEGRVFYINGTYGETGMNLFWGPTAYANATTGMYVAGGANIIYAGKMDLQTAGIEVRGGSLNVIGGSSISVNPNQAYTLRSNSKNGMATLGTAITITQHVTKLPIDVSISGGTFTAAKPLVEFDAVGNGDDSYATVNGNISGGNFYSTSDEDTVSTAHWSEYITGGDYTPARLDQSYIHPLYEDEEIDPAYWRVYPREVDMHHKTIANADSEDIISTVDLQTDVLADRRFPVEFHTINEDTIRSIKEKNPQISNLIAGASIDILRDNGDHVIVGDDNEVSLALGVTESQYDTLDDFDLVHAHLLDQENLTVSEQYPASLSQIYDEGANINRHLVNFKLMGLGTSSYVISGENLPKEEPSEPNTPTPDSPKTPNNNLTTPDNNPNDSPIKNPLDKISPNIPDTSGFWDSPIFPDDTFIGPLGASLTVPNTGYSISKANFLVATMLPAATVATTISIIAYFYLYKRANK